MPRKRKLEKHVTTVQVNGVPIRVTLRPPAGKRVSWYAWWSGLTTSRSTRQPNLEDAIAAAEYMLKTGGSKATLQDALLSDEEFEQIQQRWFERKTDPAEKKAAEQTLKDCLEAIDAFRRVTGLNPITRATADDCARFQREALKLPRNWRRNYPNGKKDVLPITANTVEKWSRQLQAAFNRVNKGAGKKCVRGVVPDAKLLTENPWTQFTGIKGTKKPIRQFSNDDLLSLLTHLESNWPGVTVVTALAKTLLWSWGRREEVASLTWDMLRQVDSEHHFDTTGKWNVRKWFRVPEGLYQELLAIRTDSPFIFGAYNVQVRQFYTKHSRPNDARKVGAEFSPRSVADWFYERLKEWSSTATLHMFRKTTMQHAREGADLDTQTARNLRVSLAVFKEHYVKPSDRQLWHGSNRTFANILASLPPEVRKRYGHDEPAPDPRKAEFETAVAAGDWKTAKRLLTALAKG